MKKYKHLLHGETHLLNFLNKLMEASGFEDDQNIAIKKSLSETTKDLISKDQTYKEKAPGYMALSLERQEAESECSEEYAKRSIFILSQPCRFLICFSLDQEKFVKEILNEPKRSGFFAFFDRCTNALQNLAHQD